MHILGKEYRVVCSQNSKKQTFIDIVPADNALHRLILQERQQRSQDTHEIAGSIKLYDMGEGNKPDIIFLPPENGGLAEVELSAAEENCLRHKIIKRFEEMMAQNLKSTIVVRPEINQAYVNGILNETLSALNASITDSQQPQSPEQERIWLENQRQNKVARTKAQTQEYLKRRDAKYSSNGLLALQIKQLTHRDY